MGFTKTKDRAFNAYNVFAGWLARRPRWVRYGIYSVIGSIFWIIYLLPRSRVRATMAALAKHSGETSPRRLYGEYVRRLISGADLAERVRHGFGGEVDGLLTIEDKERFDGILATGGMFLALPHLHASVPLTRNLANDYDVLLIVGLPTDKRRAEAQQHLYDQLGCDVLDARNEPSGSVARKTLRALRNGKIVVGTVDRIRPPPEGDVDTPRGQVRSRFFGQEVGVESWTTRFAMEGRVPIVPATARQTRDGVMLIPGQAIFPTEDLVETSQNWVAELQRLLLINPQEWTFSLDKHWSRVLIASQPE